jgi:hypothetical protein
VGWGERVRVSLQCGFDSSVRGYVVLALGVCNAGTVSHCTQ